MHDLDTLSRLFIGILLVYTAGLLTGFNIKVIKIIFEDKLNKEKK